MNLQLSIYIVCHIHLILDLSQSIISIYTQSRPFIGTADFNLGKSYIQGGKSAVYSRDKGEMEIG